MILTVIYFLVIVVWVSSMVQKKQASRKAAASRAPQSQPVPKAAGQRAADQQAANPKPMDGPLMAYDVEPAVIRPTVTLTHDHDHSGSLGDLRDEGYDPCHEEELRPAVDPALTPVAPQPTPQPGLSFSWTKDELVKGFVMGEIFSRKTR